MPRFVCSALVYSDNKLNRPNKQIKDPSQFQLASILSLRYIKSHRKIDQKRRPLPKTTLQGIPHQILGVITKKLSSCFVQADFNLEKLDAQLVRCLQIREPFSALR